ncbi:MAG: EF-hand domain-containing protein [Pirellulales bacterium]
MPARSTRLIASLVVLLAPGAIQADEPAPAAPDAARQAFEAIDANRDGLLTPEEAGEEHRRLFQRLLRNADKNADGKLDLGEFAAGLNDEPNDGEPVPPAASEQRPRLRPQDIEALFRKMDVNGDGRLTEDEVPQPHRERFSRLLRRADTDGDQALSISEFKTARGLVQRLIGSPDPAQPMPMGDARFALLVFASLDSDADGRLSAEEIEGAVEKLKKLDRNGDGLVGPRELLGAPPPPAAGTINPSRLLQRLRRADTDGDGKLKRDELPMFLQRGFERLDADGDGLADFNEIERALEAVIRRRRDRPNPSPATPPTPEQPPAGGQP